MSQVSGWVGFNDFVIISKVCQTTICMILPSANHLRWHGGKENQTCNPFVRLCVGMALTHRHTYSYLDTTGHKSKSKDCLGSRSKQLSLERHAKNLIDHCLAAVVVCWFVRFGSVCLVYCCARQAICCWWFGLVSIEWNRLQFLFLY